MGGVHLEVCLLTGPRSVLGGVVVSARGTPMQGVIEPLHLTGRLLDLATGEGTIRAIVIGHLLGVIEAHGEELHQDIGEGGAAAGASLAVHLHAGAPHAAALLFLQTDPPAVTEVALAGSAPPPAAGALLDPGPVPGLSHLPLRDLATLLQTPHLQGAAERSQGPRLLALVERRA